ncbi:MAG TPA: alpha/beta hydrolase [Pyrinomonadaceae bacterium]|nr:alpha/beta hydrolase [Pyrinomonadaceae bacterium]
MRSLLSVLVIALVLSLTVFAQEDEGAARSAPQKPLPDVANGKYGSFERNVFDLWTPKTKKPSPLVVYIHGGGFVNGDKEKLSANLLRRLLDNGIAVMAINYSLMPQYVYPQAYKDASRAIQFARSNAKLWNLDKTKVSAIGSSAGGLTSLWIGFHDDLADPKSDDPVLRESTRLSSMAVWSAQTTLVAEIVAQRVGPVTLKHSFYTGRFFGLKQADMDGEKGKQLTHEASPLSHLTKGDPPVWAFYSIPDKPQTDTTTVSEAIHHPNFGKVMKEEMDKLKIECKLRHKDDGKTVNDDVVNFLIKHFKGK